MTADQIDPGKALTLYLRILNGLDSRGADRLGKAYQKARKHYPIGWSVVRALSHRGIWSVSYMADILKDGASS